MRPRRFTVRFWMIVSTAPMPGAIGLGNFIREHGHPYLGGGTCVYAGIWMLVAIIWAGLGMMDEPFTTNKYTSSLDSALARVRLLERELAGERDLRERFQNALTDGRPS